MARRSTSTIALAQGAALLAALATALSTAAGALAQAGSRSGDAQAATTVTTVPAPAPSQEGAPRTGASASGPATSTGTTSTGMTSTGTTSTGTTPTTTMPTPSGPAPEVQSQHPQPRTVAPAARVGRPASQTRGGPASGSRPAFHAPPVAPSLLTPPLPSTLGSMAGVPSFFINSFAIPPFLLPIYQAAGAAYGIPWQVLAAINEVETDYGRDLSVSSAGAEGWMQFLPGTWGQYGVDVNNDGFQDPYNPADAIFAAARYLKAAGGDRDIHAAVLAYNHSQAYVRSVMLRARLLGGTPPALLGAVAGLTEARFPVYAPAHFADGFPTGGAGQALVGTAIYSQPDAPAIAVQDGRIVAAGDSPALGRYVSLRDAFGNTYTYAQLGTVSTVYPVLEAASRTPPPAPLGIAPAYRAAPGPVAAAALPGPVTRSFRAGARNVYLLPLRPGVHVIAGTVLGHLDRSAQPHLVFQIRPAGRAAPLIDPKPILDGWVKLQDSSAIHVGRPRAARALRLSSGQALLASKVQLERAVGHDPAIRLPACERRLIADGRVDRRVLATLEFLSAARLAPTVSASSCSQPGASAGNGGSYVPGQALDIAAIDGVAVGRAGLASVPSVLAVRKLLALQGTTRPATIAGPRGLPSAARVLSLPGHSERLHIDFQGAGAVSASAAQVFSASSLSPTQWVALVARLGEIPDPQVPAQPSPAAIPDRQPAGVAGKGGGA